MITRRGCDESIHLASSSCASLSRQSLSILTGSLVRQPHREKDNDTFGRPSHTSKTSGRTLDDEGTASIAAPVAATVLMKTPATIARALPNGRLTVPFFNWALLARPSSIRHLTCSGASLCWATSSSSHGLTSPCPRRSSEHEVAAPLHSPPP